MRYVLALIPLVLHAQQATFDVASVKVVKLADRPVFANRGGPGTNDPGRVHLCCVGLYALVMTAYDLELDQVFGPSWVMDNAGPDLYQIDATMPADTTKAQYRHMMKHLLEQRFHLEVHTERKNFPGYDLVVASGGHQLKESKLDSTAAVSDTNRPLPKRDDKGMFILPPGPQMWTSLGWGVITVQAQQKPIGDLVKVMGRMINQSLGENPNDYSSPKARVVDKTGLTGVYDFTLRFSCELCQFAAVNGALPPAPAPADSPGGEPSIFNALQKQLGLKLNKVRDIPLYVVIVDRAEKEPTAN